MLAVPRQPSGLAIRVEWTIIDATIVGAPIQHNSKEENEQIKQGEIPQGWQGEKHKAKLG